MMTTSNPLLRALTQAAAAATGPARTWLEGLLREGQCVLSPEAEQLWFQRVVAYVSTCTDLDWLQRVQALVNERLGEG